MESQGWNGRAGDGGGAPGANPATGLSRRDLLRNGALTGGLMVAGGTLLSACGGGGSTGGGAAGGGAIPANQAKDVITGPPVRGGVLRHGISGGGSSDSLNPYQINSAIDYARCLALYEASTVVDATYQIKPLLAEEFSPNKDATVWTVRYRQGVEFHNGKTLSADDVIFSIQTILDPKTADGQAGVLAAIDPNRIKKIDDRTVQFTLKSGFVPFEEAMGGTQYIVPVGFDLNNPVGTGPFKYKSFAPGQESVFERFENYWQPGKPYLDELVQLDFPDETTRINALISGQIDIADNYQPSLEPLVGAKPEVNTLISQCDSFYGWGMRADVPPFNDPRVREAMRYAIDREALIKGALSGYGRVANDLYAPQDPDYASNLPQREQDIEKAKALLKEAGQSTVEATLTTSDISAGIVEGSQLLVQQVKAAGFDIKLEKIEPTAFYGSNYGSYTMFPELQPLYDYLLYCGQLDGPTSAANNTHFKDPEFDSLYFKASKETDAAKRRQMLLEMQKIQYDRGTWLFYAFNDVLDGYRNVGGMIPDVGGLAAYRYGDIWVTG